MTDWRVSYSEGYAIDPLSNGYEYEAVIYPRGGDVVARFVLRRQYGRTYTLRRLERRVNAWIAADAATRRAMQQAELLSGNERAKWWHQFWRKHGE